MLSNKVKEQLDYKIMMNMINKCLSTNGPNGSIQVGKYYASKYLDIFNNMLSGEEVDLEILKEVLENIDTDLKEVRDDCRRRIRSQFTDSNNEMISMITDFVKSL
jgi:hypothetical protein